MAKPIYCVRAERLESCDRASVPFLNLSSRACHKLTVPLNVTDQNHLHVIINFLFIALAVFDPSLRHLSFSTG